MRRIKSELEAGERAIVIATGGLADVLAGEARTIQHVDADLTLHGLRLIWDRNQGGAARAS